MGLIGVRVGLVGMIVLMMVRGRGLLGCGHCAVRVDTRRRRHRDRLMIVAAVAGWRHSGRRCRDELGLVAADRAVVDGHFRAAHVYRFRQLGIDLVGQVVNLYRLRGLFTK